MSYSIIYDKLFIKLPNDKFVPIVLAGSSNCYDNVWNGKRYTEVRERSWHNLTYMTSGKLSETLENIISNIEEDKKRIIEDNNLRVRDEWFQEYSDKDYGYWIAIAIAISGYGTHKTTLGMYKGVFTNGCKNALTVEEMMQYGISIHVSNYKSDENSEVVSKYPKTTEELVNLIETFENSDTQIYISLNVSERSLKIIKMEAKNNRISTQRVRKEVKTSQGFVIKVDDKGYFIKKTKRGVQFSYTKNSGKQFLTEKEANKKVKDLAYKGIKFEVEPIEYSSEKTFLV